MAGLGVAARRRFCVDARAPAALRERIRDGENLGSIRFEVDDDGCHRRAPRGATSLRVREVSVRMRDQNRSGAARSSKARALGRRDSPCSRVVAPCVAPPARFVTRPLSLCSLGLAVVRKSKRFVTTDDRRSSERRSAAPCGRQRSGTLSNPRSLHPRGRRSVSGASLSSIGRPRRLPKSAIAGSERIGDPRSTEELRSSGMTNDGSRSRRSNHDHRTSSCGFLAQLRRAGCRQCRQHIP